MSEKQRLEQARVVKDRYLDALMAYPNVVGVGVGLRKRAGEFTPEVTIVVTVRHKERHEDLPAGAVLPRELDGIPVDVQEAGDIGAW